MFSFKKLLTLLLANYELASDFIDKCYKANPCECEAALMEVSAATFGAVHSGSDLNIASTLHVNQMPMTTDKVTPTHSFSAGVRLQPPPATNCPSVTELELRLPGLTPLPLIFLTSYPKETGSAGQPPPPHTHTHPPPLQDR